LKIKGYKNLVIIIPIITIITSAITADNPYVLYQYSNTLDLLVVKVKNITKVSTVNTPTKIGR
jgi:hypothetical protein